MKKLLIDIFNGDQISYMQELGVMQAEAQLKQTHDIITITTNFIYQLKVKKLLKSFNFSYKIDKTSLFERKFTIYCPFGEVKYFVDTLFR